MPTARKPARKRQPWQPNQQQARNGYSAIFQIPPAWWTSTDSPLTERERSNRRHIVRAHAKTIWATSKKQRQAWHVERFVLVITVSPPRTITNPTRIFPAKAAETCKPIIDAGTDAKLWDDDDSKHRYATTFIAVPPVHEQYWTLTVYVLPIPSHTPRWEIRHLSSSIRSAWQASYEKTPPAWYAGYNAGFTIPKRLWLTSNITDSDLHNMHHEKQVAWGSGRAHGERERIRQQLQANTYQQWQRQYHLWANRFTLEIGVSYPPAVGDADPDNAAETVNTVLQAGTRAGAWDAITAANCKAVTFYRQANNMTPGIHKLNITVTPIPDTCTASSLWVNAIRRAWRMHDERSNQ